jgi:hypothetical protein
MESIEPFLEEAAGCKGWCLNGPRGKIREIEFTESFLVFEAGEVAFFWGCLFFGGGFCCGHDRILLGLP